ncbi:response regulator transcription factor [Staphylospora marina]|uniref:response regulator transcription factor n=1 Tax=Staphylospora marina TaxID=2490858 RepID=UPI000F5C0505|nr:helix-turn-helix transcriptional regulator [Staphylospora marina]
MKLTAREREVALLVACGYTDTEIAEELGVSRRRICEIVSSIKFKWKTRSRVEIGIIVYYLGWIKEELSGKDLLSALR